MIKKKSLCKFSVAIFLQNGIVYLFPRFVVISLFRKVNDFYLKIFFWRITTSSKLKPNLCWLFLLSIIVQLLKITILVIIVNPLTVLTYICLGVIISSQDVYPQLLYIRCSSLLLRVTILPLRYKLPP